MAKPYIIGPTRFVAICEDCEGFENLDAMPVAGDFWPECRGCEQPMNVYERNLPPTVGGKRAERTP